MLDFAPATGMLLMGFAGSAHCAAMCGAIFGACAQGAASGGRSGVTAALALHGGRLLSYSALGALCGAAGAVVDWGAGALALPRVAAIVAGVVMVGLALDQLGARSWIRNRLRSAGVSPAPSATPNATRTTAGIQQTPLAAPGSAGVPPAPSATPTPSPTGLFGRVLGAALRSPGGSGLFAVGAALGILPCGLLYGAAAAAAASADPLKGAVLMACFALGGAVPLMGLGQVFRWLWARGAGNWVNRAAAAIVLLLGIGAITGRIGGNPGLAGHDHHLHTGTSGAGGHARQHEPGTDPAAEQAVTGAPGVPHHGTGHDQDEHAGHSH